MDNANYGINLLIEAAEDFSPSKTGDGVAHFGSINLYVAIRELQSMDAGHMSLFISEINASIEPGQPAINVTCVGMAEDIPSVVGATVARSDSDDLAEPPPHLADLTEQILELLCAKRLVQRVHWLELFASKSDDGEIDATCRLNNRDWLAGQQQLNAIAAEWPDSDQPLQTCRQFVMLLPTNGDREQIVLPSFWSRLFGGA